MEIKFLDSRLNEYGFTPATEQAAGYDLRACVKEPVILLPNDMVKIPTGIAVHMIGMNEDHILPCAVIMPRSGLGCRGVKPRNTPGLIDADYQGEIVVCLFNEGCETYTVQPMERIAQLVFMLTFHPKFNRVSEFASGTKRGESGFGSTGAS